MQCFVCMISGRVRMVATIVDGQALCGQHAVLWDQYMMNNSYLSNPASTHSRAFLYWREANNHG